MRATDTLDSILFHPLSQEEERTMSMINRSLLVHMHQQGLFPETFGVISLLRPVHRVRLFTMWMVYLISPEESNLPGTLRKDTLLDHYIGVGDHFNSTSSDTVDPEIFREWLAIFVHQLPRIPVRTFFNPNVSGVLTIQIKADFPEALNRFAQIFTFNAMRIIMMNMKTVTGGPLATVAEEFFSGPIPTSFAPNGSLTTSQAHPALFFFTVTEEVIPGGPGGITAVLNCKVSPVDIENANTLQKIRELFA